MGDGDTGVNALIGAVATTVLVGVVPFAPVAGGALAGYLQGGDRSNGTRVGLYAGLIALVPAILITMFVGAIVAGIAGFGGFPALGSVGIAVLLFILLVAAVYVVGLSMLGGWLGNYLRHETDVGGSSI